MRTFKAYFKKEILEGIRHYKYLILFAGIVFFAISDPIMMKLLPKILKGQLHGDISSLFIVTRKTVMQSYIKDLFQIGLMFVVFTTSSSLSDEISTEKFVFPYSKGSSPAGIILAKILHYSMIVTIITLCGFCINFYYTNSLFAVDEASATISLVTVLTSGIMVSLYFVFCITLSVLFSSLLKRGVVAGFIVLFMGYFSLLPAKLDLIRDFVPYRLIESATELSSSIALKSSIIVLFYSLLIIILTITHMRRVEVI